MTRKVVIYEIAFIKWIERNKGIMDEICRILAKQKNDIYFTSCDFYDDQIKNISS